MVYFKSPTLRICMFVCLFVSASIVPLVAMLSAPLASPLCSYLGRRRTMMTMTIPMAAGWLIITFAKGQ